MDVIPETINATNLEQISTALDQDLQWAVSIESIAATTALGDDTIGTNSATLRGCAANADSMAVDAGLLFGDYGSPDDFVALHGVHGMRNVGLRRQQNQQTPKVTPDFNSDMQTNTKECPHPGEGSTTMEQ